MIWAMASAPVIKNKSASGRILRRSRKVSIVKVGPGLSMSTRLTVNWGFAAVAMTVIKYLCSAALTWFLAFCHGSPVGTKITSSSLKTLATSLAATRWPWWIGSNVPPMTPTRRRPLALSTEGAKGVCSVIGGRRIVAVQVLVRVLAVRVLGSFDCRVAVAQVHE